MTDYGVTAGMSLGDEVVVGDLQKSIHSRGLKALAVRPSADRPKGWHDVRFRPEKKIRTKRSGPF